MPRSRVSLWLLLFLFVPLGLAGAQQRRLTGRITGSAGEPLGSATVLVAGTRVGTQTADDGRYTLLAPEGAIQLSVRRIGYKPRTLPVAAGQNELDVQLERDVLQLSELVITGQGTSVARANAANDVATVSAQELLRAPTPTMENALQGKVAGAQVTQNSGAPGGGIQVQLRGVTTINAATGPLYVVDGVIVSNDAIASGANAITAAAAGGNSSNQDNPVNRIADLNPNDIERIEILKGASASAIYGSKASNGVILITTKKGRAGTPSFNITQRVGTFALSNTLGSRRWTLSDVLAGAADAADSAEATALFGSGRATDYEKQLYGERDLSYETALSANGGTAATRYYLSGLAKRDAGIMQGTGYDKQALRANLSQTIGSRITLDVNSAFTHALTRRGLSNNDNSGTSYYMVLPFTRSYAQLGAVNGVFPNNPFQPSNPLQTRALLQNDEDVYRFTGSVQGNISLMARERQTLDLRLIGGVDQFNQRNDIYAPNDLQFENDNLPGTSVLGSATVVSSNIYVTGVHGWTPATLGISTTTSLGVQQERRSYNGSSTLARGLFPGQRNADQATNVNVDPTRQRVLDFALYAQEEVLALDERLLVTVGARADRSTNNGDKDKFYVFPKGSISYRFPGLWRLDELKLRSAVGQSGNPAVFGSRFTPLATSAIDSRICVQVGTIAGADDIRPERQTEVEGGFDMAFANGRASLAVTGYQKSIDDLILLRDLAGSTGSEQEYFNGAALRNRGLEIGAQFVPLQRNRTEWVSRIVFARNVSRITELPVPTFQTGGFGVNLGSFQIEEGKSATQIVGNKVIQNAAGDDTTVVVALGDAMPDFTVGFSNELAWRNWRLSGLVDWRQGGDIINLTEFLYDAGSNAKDFEAGAQRFTRWGAGNTGEYVQDGSFVKLREVSLSYTLGQDMVTRLFGSRARSVRLELAGRNLLVFTDYRGLDPEVSNFGNQAIARNIDVAPFPPSRSFFFTIDVGF